MWLRHIVKKSSCIINESIIARFMGRAGMFIHDAGNVAQKYLSICETSNSLRDAGQIDKANKFEEIASQIEGKLESFIRMIDVGNFNKARLIMLELKETKWLFADQEVSIQM